MMTLDVRAGRAYCRRDGCWHRIGTVVVGWVGGQEGGIRADTLDLEAGPRDRWVEAPDAKLEHVWVLRRQRHAPRLDRGVVHRQAAAAAEVVECPRCRARQMVPPLATPY